MVSDLQFRGLSAKTEYNAILADVDYLHGLAESFLTLTNLFIVAAFRKAVLNANRQGPYDGEGAVATGDFLDLGRSIDSNRVHGSG